MEPLAKLEDQSEWVKLYSPNANGILGIITCLYWWGKSTLGKVEVGVVQDAGKIAEWKEAVENVQWTLQALLLIHILIAVLTFSIIQFSL